MPFGQVTHDWTVNVGEWDFGMREYYWPPMPQIIGPGMTEPHRLTMICVGPIHYTVRYSAPAILLTFIAGSAVVVFVVAHFFSKFSRRRNGTQ